MIKGEKGKDPLGRWLGSSPFRKVDSSQCSKSNRVLFIFSGSCQQQPPGFLCGFCQQLQLCSHTDSCVCRSNGEFHRTDSHSGSRNLKTHKKKQSELDKWHPYLCTTSLLYKQDICISQLWWILMQFFDSVFFFFSQSEAVLFLSSHKPCKLCFKILTFFLWCGFIAHL